VNKRAEKKNILIFWIINKSSKLHSTNISTCMRMMLSSDNGQGGRGRGRRPHCKRIARSPLTPHRYCHCYRLYSSSHTVPKPARPPPRVRVAFFYSDHRPRPTRRVVSKDVESYIIRRARSGTRPAIIAYDALFLSFFLLFLLFSLSSLSSFSSFSYSLPISFSIAVHFFDGARTDRLIIWRISQHMKGIRKNCIDPWKYPPYWGEISSYSQTVISLLTSGRHFRAEFYETVLLFLFVIRIFSW